MKELKRNKKKLFVYEDDDDEHARNVKCPKLNMYEDGMRELKEAKIRKEKKRKDADDFSFDGAGENRMAFSRNFMSNIA